MIIAITGKSGSGKTLASKILSFYFKNSIIIDVDRLGKSLLGKKDVMLKLKKTFGEKIFKNAKVDTKILAKTAFSNKSSLVKLNKIVHPQLILLIKRQLELHQKTNKNIIIDAALYDELNIGKISNFTLLVKTNSINAKKRLELGVFQRRKYQVETKDYDLMIYNNSNIKEFKSSLKQIASKIKELSIDF